jgi:hypothetical protein
VACRAHQPGGPDCDPARERSGDSSGDVRGARRAHLLPNGSPIPAALEYRRPARGVRGVVADDATQQEYVWMRIAPNEVRGRRLHVIDNTPWREK